MGEQCLLGSHTTKLNFQYKEIRIYLFYLLLHVNPTFDCLNIGTILVNSGALLSIVSLICY